MEAERLLRAAARWYREHATEDASSCNIVSVIGKELDETHVHSKLIYYLLSGQDPVFLKEFLRAIRIPQRYIDGPWTVRREKAVESGRIDFVMESDHFFAVLEMKLEAADGPKQLERYDREGKRRGKPYLVYYLTPYGTWPDEQSMGKMDRSSLRLISFKREIAGWLEACMENVDPDSYACSFLRQYLGTVRQITGLDEGTRNVADLITDAETGKAARLIVEAFNARMEEVKESFFAETGSVIKRKSRLDTSVSWDGARTVIDHVTKGKITCQFILWVSANYDAHPYASMGFSLEPEGEVFEFMEFAEAQKKFPSFYRRWMEKLEELSLPKTLRRDKRTRWFYLENSGGELFDFKSYNDAALALIDEEERKKQCAHIGDCLVKLVLRPLRKGM